MEEAFFRTHTYLVEHTEAPVRRTLMDEIDWSDRLIGIKGTRGVGKSTFLLQYAKEHFGPTDRKCLYVNMNNFYFQSRGIADFAGDFVRHGGRTLLIDQVFKQSDWSKELRKCYDLYPELRIVFTGSSVMRLKEENPELNGIVKSYNLRGFSFREFINLQTGNSFKPYTLDEILRNHEHIIKQILPKVSPMKYFQDYLHHGFYPFFLENRNFTENLTKDNEHDDRGRHPPHQANRTEISHQDQAALLSASCRRCQGSNVSQLAEEINTSRATVMNYIKYLADARLINMIYPTGQEFPKKPSKVMMHNSNLMYAIYPIKIDKQEVMETFFVNSVWKDHKVSQTGKDHYFIVDGEKKFRICDAQSPNKVRNNPDIIYARYNTEVGKDNRIPLWLLGFLY